MCHVIAMDTLRHVIRILVNASIVNTVQEVGFSVNLYFLSRTTSTIHCMGDDWFDLHAFVFRVALCHHNSLHPLSFTLDHGFIIWIE